VQCNAPQLRNMIQFVTLECLKLGNWCPVIRDLWVAWGLLQRTRYLRICESCVHWQQTQPEHAFIRYIVNLTAQVLIMYNVEASMIHPGIGFQPENWNVILGITCMEPLLIKERPHWMHPL
jgi:hypothetical protein